METYKEMKDRHQAEVNALPLAFAFSDRQYKEKLALMKSLKSGIASTIMVGKYWGIRSKV